MEKQQKRIEVLGFDSGWGCKDYGCEDGPYALSSALMMHDLARLGLSAKWRGPLGLKKLGEHDRRNTKERTLPLLKTSLERLFNTVQISVENGHIPVVIGGDHSSAIGTWSAVVTAKDAHEDFGMIWIDAHLDAHTHETSSEGKWGGWWHGQPVSALTGHGLPTFTGLGGTKTKISPEHLSLIGIRSFEPSEKAFVEERNIRVYYIEEVEERGFQTVFDEALARAQQATKGFGISIDLDGFCPDDAPAVGTLEEGGLLARDVLPVLRGLAQQDGFSALEIAEFNPHNDINGQTRRLIEKLINSIFSNAGR
ncbi:MAG: arginase [Alphaproteobacteria bacterium]|nr:arginase [Alphaproteobacteria bacterium]